MVDGGVETAADCHVPFRRSFFHDRGLTVTLNAYRRIADYPFGIIPFPHCHEFLAFQRVPFSTSTVVSYSG
jgi:hypothetical protein